jgi:hypothetical protein
MLTSILRRNNTRYYRLSFHYDQKQDEEKAERDVQMCGEQGAS